MSVNPITGIDPVADRFLRIFIPDLQAFDPNNRATYNIVQFSEPWPRFDGGPINNPPTNEMRFKVLPTQAVATDHRYSLAEQPVLLMADPQAPAGHPHGTYQIIRTPVKRPLETLIAQIETAFQQQVRIQFPDSQNPTTMMLVDAATLKKQNGGTLTALEQLIVDAYMVTVGKIALLAERRDEMIAAATNDEDYDIELWPDLT